MIEDILDMMRHDATISEEQLQAVSKDPEAIESCRDILYARRIHRKGELPDVEMQLSAFKKQHLLSQKHPLRIIAIFIGAAAVFIGLLLLFTTNDLNTDLLIQTAHIEKSSPILTATNGQEIPFQIIRERQLIDPEIQIGSGANVEIKDTLVLNVPNGKTYQILLPDGSRVFLHPGSRLIYPSCFYGKTREVKLNGEAYFIVKRDSQHPFIVTTNRSRTRVLGTEFDITSYPEQPEAVTLVTGSVSFKSVALQDSTVITPGQQATIETNGNLSISSVDTDSYTMWRDGYFYFDQQQLKDVLTELGRYYDVKIESYNQKALSCRIRFICKRDADLHAVIDNINLMKICKASMEKNKLVIK